MAPKSNRIEVDLQVMQNDAIAKLENFGKDFNNTVGRLGSLLENVTQVTQGTSLAGGLGDNASTVASTAQSMEGTERPRISGDDSGTGTPSNTTLNQPPPGPPGGPSTPGDGSLESQLIDVQRRVMGDESAIPSSFRQALGYYGAGQLEPNLFKPASPKDIMAQRAQIDAQVASGEMTQEEGSTAKKQALAKRANDVIFNYQATKALATNAMGKYSGFFGGVQNITSSGYQTAPNTGTHGLFGSSLFSGAFWHGLNESVWQPLVTSTFGLNPAYSLGQAQQARQAINQYGWSSGNMGDFLANTLKENTIHYQLDPQTQMSFLDPMMRWGGWQSFGQLNTVLAGISSAAQSAGMNLNQFTQELVQTSQQVAMQTGNTPGVVAGEISSISATTGLSPEVAGQMESLDNIQLAASYTGKNPWDIYTGKQNQAVLAVGLSRFRNYLGMPVDQFMKMKNSPNAAVRNAWKMKMWGATRLFGTDPQIFGGSSPLQMLHEISQAGSTKALLTQTHLRDRINLLGDMPNTRLDTTLEHILREYPGENEHQRNQMVQKYMSYVHGTGKSATASMRKGYAENLLGGNAAQKRLHASRKIMIELSGDAKKYFQLANDPGHTNSGQSFGRKAISWGETAVQDTVDHIPGVGGIANAFGY